MFLQAKPKAYKTYIQDKDASLVVAAQAAKLMSDDELQKKLSTVISEIESRLDEETSEIDAKLNGEKQAYVAEMVSRGIIEDVQNWN